MSDIDYTKYKSEDFVQDSKFYQWVVSPDDEVKAFWKEWLTQNPQMLEEVTLAKIMLTSIIESRPSYKLSEQKSKAILEKSVQAYYQTRQKDSKPEPAPKTVPIQRSLFKWVSVAAAIGLIVSIVVINKTWDLAGETYKTEFGEIRHVTLADGSEVVLNGNSQLKIPKTWDTGQARNVWLKGEAFFSVQHLTSETKFVVHTADLQVEVLGTEFNVNNRRNKTKVVLSSGKIKVNLEKNKQTLEMQPGDFIEFSSQSNEINKKKVDSKKYTAWTNFELTFHSTPVEEVFETLEDVYGYSVVVENQVDFSGLSLTSKVSARDPEILLRVLENTFQMKIRRNKKQLLITK